MSDKIFIKNNKMYASIIWTLVIKKLDKSTKMNLYMLDMQTWDCLESTWTSIFYIFSSLSESHLNYGAPIKPVLGNVDIIAL